MIEPIFSNLFMGLGLNFHILKKENVPQHVLGDMHQLYKVLMNLLNNAIKFTDHGSIILAVEEIKASAESTKLYFVVNDTGIGIPKKNLERIFEPLFSTKVYGIGLGLTFVKNIIEMHKGKIEIDSETDIGTKFTIKLPIKKEEGI